MLEVSKLASRWLELYEHFSGAENRAGAWIKYPARRNGFSEFKELTIQIADHCTERGWDSTSLYTLSQKIDPGRPPRHTIPAGSQALLEQSWAIVRRVSMPAIGSMPVVTFSSDGTAEIAFDGKLFSNIDYEAAQIVQELVDHYPTPHGLHSDERPQPRRILNKLPPAIQEIIETVQGKGRVLKLSNG